MTLRRLTAPLWVPVLACCFGVMAAIVVAGELWREAYS